MLISTTINPTYTPGEIARQLEFSEASFVITTSGMLDTLKEAIGKLGEEQKTKLSGKRILVVGGMFSNACTVNIIFCDTVGERH